MKLLVFRSEQSLDAVLVFVKDCKDIEEADALVAGDYGNEYTCRQELEVIGDDEELYMLHCYEG